MNLAYTYLGSSYFHPAALWASQKMTRYGVSKALCETRINKQRFFRLSQVPSIIQYHSIEREWGPFLVVEWPIRSLRDGARARYTQPAVVFVRGIEGVPHATHAWDGLSQERERCVTESLLLARTRTCMRSSQPCKSKTTIIQDMRLWYKSAKDPACVFG